MSEPYWLEEPAPPLPRVALKAEPDACVVGGGVTGCACALRLAEAGLRVRLYEARRVASGASGRNGGFALRGGAMSYDRAREQLGAERARSLWMLTERALDRMEELAGDAFRRSGSLKLAVDADEGVELEAERDALRADGFRVEWRDAPLPRFAAGIFHPRDGTLQPARWVRRLALRAVEAGVEIREHERVGSLADLDAEQVVVATDGYTGGLLPSLERVVRPTRGQVLVTEPLPLRLFAYPHYARRGYDYWQQTDDLRLVIGGRRDVSVELEYTAEEGTTRAVQDAIEAMVRELLGYAPRVTHRWSGLWGSTPDGLPIAGRLDGDPRVWVAYGYSGHGNVLGLACGELVADAILGRPAPALALFDPARPLKVEARDVLV